MKKLIVVIGIDEKEVLCFLLNVGRYRLYHKYFDDTHPFLIRGILRKVIEKEDSLAISTDNPYVLGEINNLLYASNVAKMNPDKADEIKAIIPEKYWINECEAYEIIDGKPVSIYDEELQLIRNEALDGASKRINEEFDRISKNDTGGEYVI